MTWAEAARRLDDRVLGEAGGERARRRNRVLLMVALAGVPGVTAAKAWSGPVGLAVAVALIAPIVGLVRLAAVRGPEWVDLVQRSERPLTVRLRRWDARVFGSQPSTNRVLDFLNSLGNSPWVAPAYLSLSFMSLTLALVCELASEHELAGQALRSAGYGVAAAFVSRVAWKRRCVERRLSPEGESAAHHE